MKIDLSWHGLTQPGNGENYFGIDPLPPFNPYRGSFDPVNAFWLSEICRLFYRRNPEESSYRQSAKPREVFLTEAACEEILFIGRQETQCALLQSRNGPKPFAVLVFRGTTGFRNWLLDLDVRPEKMGRRAIVHRGFLESLQRVWDHLQPVLDGLEVPCFFTGHSMGGALAQLAATRFRPRAVYCFGAPRVGDGGYVEVMRPINVYRVVNNRDIVAVLPPASPILSFQPAGQLVHICSRGLLHQIGDEASAALDCNAEEEAAAASPESRWHDPPRFLADHAPINYSARIGQYLLGIPAVDCENAACPQIGPAAAAGP